MSAAVGSCTTADSSAACASGRLKLLRSSSLRVDVHCGFWKQTRRISRHQRSCNERCLASEKTAITFLRTTASTSASGVCMRNSAVTRSIGSFAGWLRRYVSRAVVEIAQCKCAPCLPVAFLLSLQVDESIPDLQRASRGFAQASTQATTIRNARQPVSSLIDRESSAQLGRGSWRTSKPQHRHLHRWFEHASHTSDLYISNHLPA
jgi:hypothetical protein